jgi:hypothetical protein
MLPVPVNHAKRKLPANSRRHGNRQENIQQHDFHPNPVFVPVARAMLQLTGHRIYISGRSTDGTTSAGASYPTPPAGSATRRHHSQVESQSSRSRQMLHHLRLQQLGQCLPVSGIR